MANFLGPALTERTDNQKIHRVYFCQEAKQLTKTTSPGRPNTSFRNSQNFRDFSIRGGFPLIKEQAYEGLAPFVQLRHGHADPLLLLEDQQLLVRQRRLVAHCLR